MARRTSVGRPGARCRVRVIVLLQGLGPLDYATPGGRRREPGRIVQVPLGPRLITGGVWEADRLPATEVDDARLRPVAGVYDLPPLPAPVRRLVEWVADYYLAPHSAVLRMVLASAFALAGGRPSIAYRVPGMVP